MRIVLIGTVEFSARAFRKLLDIGVDISGVVTKGKTSFHSDFFSLVDMAAQAGIDCMATSSVNTPAALEWISGRHPDYIFCLGWSELINKELLVLPAKGVIGFHPALLPMNRGRHPIIWALALGLEKTGSTFFIMDEGADSGDIVSQRVVPVMYEDDARTLYDRITDTALAQIGEFCHKLADGSLRPVPQAGAEANYWRKRSHQDGEIDWRMPSRGIYNLVRALTRPYPGAHFVFRGEEYKVWRVVECDAPANLEPGRVMDVRDDGNIVIKAGQGAVCLMELDRMPAGLKEGDYLQ